MNYAKFIKYKKYFNIINENSIMNKINIKKYLIKNPNDIINNDDSNGHIRPFIQNLILIYTPKCTQMIDDNNTLSIAMHSSELHSDIREPQSPI